MRKLIAALLATAAFFAVTASEVLIEDVDYTLSYKDNVNTGCATVTITGIGGYEGTLSKTFWIYKYGFFYTGAEICPKVRLTYRGKELTEGTDYELSYANNIEVGNGQITVSGKGNFVGIKLMYFQIIPSDNVTTPAAQRWNDSQVIRTAFGR